MSMHYYGPEIDLEAHMKSIASFEILNKTDSKMESSTKISRVIVASEIAVALIEATKFQSQTAEIDHYAEELGL